MKLTLSLIAFVITGDLFAQTKKVTTTDDTLNLKEKYSVLKSDPKVKQGPYALYSLRGGKLLCKGFYKNNQKDSIWTSYDYQRNVEIVYDYGHKWLIDYKKSRWDNSKNDVYAVINGIDTTQKKLDQPPIYLDGDGKRLAIVIMKTRYPAKAKENNIQGKAIIAFTINANGDVSNYRIKKRVGGGCDEEALRITELIKGEWLPGMLNGTPVKVEYEMPFTFTLSSN